jgi:hypothetical protein
VKKHTGFAVLASIACCPKARFKIAAEKRSSTFSVNGSWLLRWSTNCKNVPSSQQPIMYIAVIPAGSKNPIQFIQEPMPTNGAGSGLATENLHGRYYLDAISKCHIFGAVAYGQRGAHVSAGTQASAISEARGKGQEVALKAVRTRLLIRARSQAKARALALARTRYVADLSAIVSQVSAARKTLSTASGSINSTSSDFDPSILKAAKDYANAASQELRASNRQLDSVKTFPQHGKLKQIIKSAIAHLNDAVTLVLQTTNDIAAGNSDTAASDLAGAVAKIKTGARQIKHAERNLTILKTSK